MRNSLCVSILLMVSQPSLAQVLRCEEPRGVALWSRKTITSPSLTLSRA